LSSGATFSGNAVVGSVFGQGSGPIAGRFYGPSAQEVGATFSATNGSGLAAVGSFVGQRDRTATPVQQTLLDPTYPQTFSTDYGWNSIGSLQWLDAETFDFGAPISDMGDGRFTIDDKVASADPNFTAYRKHTPDEGYGEEDVELRMYKPGGGNTELPLTYASFGHWAGTRAGSTQNSYFAYGYPTGQNLLAAKTGSAHYEGVAYGSGLRSDGLASYDVKGSSVFDVDFGNARFTAAITLAGSERATGRSVDFGRVDLTGTEDARTAALVAAAGEGGGGDLSARFYGPDGEELAGTFYLIVPAADAGKDVGLQGAVAAVRK
jgi:hypothetical protein